jgi:hypothetical protein
LEAIAAIWGEMEKDHSSAAGRKERGEITHDLGVLRALLQGKSWKPAHC